MIYKECKTVCRNYNYSGGLSIIISIPDGKELARRTFNPRLGIVDGLSILGTTGIVEPRSESAIIGTLRAQLSLLYAAGYREVVLTIGNYGEQFARNNLSVSGIPVKCSNFIGETLGSERDLNELC